MPGLSGRLVVIAPSNPDEGCSTVSMMKRDYVPSPMTFTRQPWVER